MNVSTNGVILLPSSGNRPSVSLQNKGNSAVKIDFNKTADWNDDNGLILEVDERIAQDALNGNEARLSP